MSRVLSPYPSCSGWLQGGTMFSGYQWWLRQGDKVGGPSLNFTLLNTYQFLPHSKVALLPLSHYPLNYLLTLVKVLQLTLLHSDRGLSISCRNPLQNKSTGGIQPVLKHPQWCSTHELKAADPLMGQSHWWEKNLLLLTWDLFPHRHHPLSVLPLEKRLNQPLPHDSTSSIRKQVFSHLSFSLLSSIAASIYHL